MQGLHLLMCLSMQHDICRRVTEFHKHVVHSMPNRHKMASDLQQQKTCIISSSHCVLACRYGLLDECRVLLVHGLLHLLGYDHEAGDADAAAMAAAERQLLRALGWQVCNDAALSMPSKGSLRRRLH